jgi:hypothetical protein
MVTVVQHIEDCTIGGNKKAVKINANKIMDEEVYIVLRDVPTRQIDFMVKPVENIAASGIVVNAFDVLRGAKSRDRVLLPMRRATLDNTTDDVLHNDIITWLEKNESGWPRDEANELGRDFVNRLTAAFFPLTNAMFSAMSDVHNAGINPRSSILFFHILFKFQIFALPLFLYAVRPFPYSSLLEFVDRKKNDKKGKQVQERLESSLLAFDTAFFRLNRTWRKYENCSSLLETLHNLQKSVYNYYNRYAGFFLVIVMVQISINRGRKP